MRQGNGVDPAAREAVACLTGGRWETSMITVTCDCGAKLRVKDELAGKKGKCPKCGQIIALVQQDLQIDDTPVTQVSPSSDGGTEKRVCPGCGARIPSLSFSCEFCGASVREEAHPMGSADRTPDVGTESEGAFASLFRNSNDAEHATILRDIGNLPDSPEGLVSLFAKYVEGAGVDGRIEQQKAQACRAAVTKLRVFAAGDSHLLGLVRDLQSQLDKRLQHSKRQTAWILASLITVIVLVFGGCFVYFGIVAPRHDAGVRQDIQRLVEQERFGEARIRAAALWSSPKDREKDVNTLIESIDKAERTGRR